MNNMFKLKHLLLLAALFPFVSLNIGSAIAAKGEVPNGQPFQALQKQITDLETYLNDEFFDVWARIGELQTAIDANNARDDLQDELISLLGSALGSLEARVTSNEDAIAALEAKDLVLEGLINALSARADGLQAQIDAEGDRIDLLILMDQTQQQSIDALNERVTTLEGLMTTANTDIAAIENEIVSLNTRIGAAESAINEKQALVWDYCGTGYSISHIYSNGSVDCAANSGGFTSFSVDDEYAETNANTKLIWEWATATATCPSGSKRTGGGFWMTTDTMTPAGSYPYGLSSWRVYVGGTMPISFTFRSYVVCLTLN